MKQKMLKVLASAMTFTMLASVVPNEILTVVQAEENNKIRRTEDRKLGPMGTKLPTEEEQKEFDKRSTKIGEIKNNELALQRIKDEYGEVSGLESPVERGKEIVEEGNSNNTRSYSQVKGLLPSVVDNSSTKYFPEIASQEQIGSCAAFSTTYYQMSYMMAFDNNIDIKKSPDSAFSPKWTYSLNNGGQDAGSTIIDNIDTMKEVGVVDLRTVPYLTDETNYKSYREWSTDVNHWRYANGIRVRQYGTLNIPQGIKGSEDSQLDEVKTMLNNGYVLTFGTYMAGTEMTSKDNIESSNDNDSNGAFKPKNIHTSVVWKSTGHAMTIVGYNDDIWVDVNNNTKIDPEEKGAFKVANSWGKEYGEEGYEWYLYDSLNSVTTIPEAPETPVGLTRTGLLHGNQVYFMNTEKLGQPKLSVEFTVEHSKRDELEVELFSRSKSTGKEIKHKVRTLSNAGGSFNFNGDNTETSSTITFAVPYDEILDDPSFFSESFDEFGIILADYRVNGKPLKIKEIKLVDSKGTVVSSVKEDKPVEIEGTKKEYKFDYKLDNTGDIVKPGIQLDEREKAGDGNYRINIDGSQPNGKKVKYKLYEGTTLVKESYNNEFGDGKDFYEASNKRDGIYSYKLVIEDESKNVAEAPILEVRVNNMKPIELAVDEGDKKFDGKYTVKVNTSQNYDRSYKMKLYEDNNLIKEIQGQGDYKFDVPMTKTKDGIYNYRVNIEDDLGNFTYSNSEIVYADVNKDFVTKPKVTIDSLENPNDGKYNVNYDGSQADGKQLLFALYQNGVMIKESFRGNVSDCKGNYTISNNPKGKYQYILIVKDKYTGKMDFSDPTEFEVKDGGIYKDLETPRIGVNELLYEQDGHYTIDFDGTQSDGTQLNYELYQNGKLFRTSKVPSNAKESIPFAGMPNGVYSYQVKITDIQGNSRVSNVVSVTVNNRTAMTVEPRVKLDSPIRNNDKIGMTLNFGNSNLAKSTVELYEDGKVIKNYVNTTNEVRFETSKTDKLNHRYKLVVKDELGFKHESSEVTVYSNRATSKLNKPTITPNTTVSRDGRISITVDATNSTEKVREFYLLENDKSIMSASGYQKTTLNAGVKPNGIYEYQVIAMDNLLNGIATDKVIVKVEKGAYDLWQVSKSYKIGDRVVYNGSTYECTYEHFSQPNWAPSQTGALWKKLY